jgi:hypothetical protein
MPEIEERFDKIDQHLKFVKLDLRDVLTALTGTDANGKKGIVYDINEINGEIEVIQKSIELIKLENAKREILLDQIKFGVGAAFVIILGIVINLVSGIN